ncbi:uncharacterized protein G2W53_005029 [Senna tora]|uniref:Uncharacterized protein n=1 Tax=Senna tora TaxID=362788 RepID=A0A835CIQ5_9FABA|nr:uncharacterized protein G2W53_005029 [Senna tora]
MAHRRRLASMTRCPKLTSGSTPATVVLQRKILSVKGLLGFLESI